MAEYMTGSEGNPDYLVIAKHGHVLLGIKFLAMQVHPNKGMMLGLRVRAAFDPAKSYLNPKSSTITEAFPAIEWQKTPEPDKGPLGNRASTVMAMVAPVCPFFTQHVRDFVEKAKFFEKIVDWLAHSVSPEDAAIGPEELNGYLLDAFNAYLKPLEELVAHLNSPGPDYFYDLGIMTDAKAMANAAAFFTGQEAAPVTENPTDAVPASLLPPGFLKKAQKGTED